MCEEMSTTPLEMLSNAAVLMETSAASHNVPVSGEKDHRQSSPAKDHSMMLGQKLKRSKDSQELYSTLPGKLRIKWNCSPKLAVTRLDGRTVDSDSDAEGHVSPPLAPMDTSRDVRPGLQGPGFSSSEVPVNFQARRELAASRDSYSESDNESPTRTSPPHLPPFFGDGRESDSGREGYYYRYGGSEEIADYDQPLDMSKKCPTREDAHLVPDYQKPKSVGPTVDSPILLQQLQRPSVITCASALLRSQCNLKDPVRATCTGNQHCASNDDEFGFDCLGCGSGERTSDRSTKKEVRQGHRREILSGMCDPVIDEHFRRSLGKDYTEVFSAPSSTSVSITVDDHFAKALGETWLRLQQPKTPGCDASSAAAPSQARVSSRSPPSPPQPIIAHPQSLVSL